MLMLLHANYRILFWYLIVFFFFFGILDVYDASEHYIKTHMLCVQCHCMAVDCIGAYHIFFTDYNVNFIIERKEKKRNYIFIIFFPLKTTIFLYFQKKNFTQRAQPIPALLLLLEVRLALNRFASCVSFFNLSQKREKERKKNKLINYLIKRWCYQLRHTLIWYLL